MNEYTHQRGGASASPSTQIHGAEAGSRSEEFVPQSPRPQGRHRLHRSSGLRAASFLPFRAIAVTVTAAALAAAAFAVSTHHEPAASAAAQSALSAPQLTKADVQQLQHMTPTEAARLTADLNAAYGKFGVHVGVGPSSASTLPNGAAAGKATLTSYQWAAGIQWDHAWVTASYADLEPIANNASVIANTATWFCNKLKGGYAFACYAVGTVIASFLGKVHVTNWSSNHGVWGAYYWFPWSYKTGGLW
jgi:hypothetical protein